MKNNTTLLGSFISPQSITLIFENDTVSADNSHPKFGEIFKLCKAGKFADAAQLFDLGKVVSTDYAAAGIQVRGGEIYRNGVKVENVIGRRIVAMLKEGSNPLALVNFLNNLLQNPSFTAVNELYLFLEHNQIPITEDGHFLAWKKVRKDFKDIHSGTFDYSPGKIVEMPANEVDDSRENTCSKGLHAAGWSYLPHFGSRDADSDRIVIVKINPAHVRCVPSDYNNAKLRASKMTVLREYTDRKVEANEFGRAVLSSDGNELTYDDSRIDAFDDDFWDCSHVTYHNKRDRFGRFSRA
jgi:hypothetical protein